MSAMAHGSSASSSSGGIGFLGMLAILFIGLKLGGIIQWSWFWVLSPLLIGFLLFGVACMVMLVLFSFVEK